MQIDDSKETLIESSASQNHATPMGMGEYAVHFSSDNDSDRDITDWLSSSEGRVLDCFNIEISSEKDIELYFGDEQGSESFVTCLLGSSDDNEPTIESLRNELHFL